MSRTSKKAPSSPAKPKGRRERVLTGTEALTRRIAALETAIRGACDHLDLKPYRNKQTGKLDWVLLGQELEGDIVIARSVLEDALSSSCRECGGKPEAKGGCFLCGVRLCQANDPEHFAVSGCPVCDRK